jgi:hypothetical protein
MRVVYYTRPCFLDAALSFVPYISSLAEVHMLLELPPDGWRSNILDVGIRDLPRGIVDGDSALKAFFPEGVRAQWTAARSFNLVVHKNRRSIHPDAAYVSLKATRFIRGLTPYSSSARGQRFSLRCSEETETKLLLPSGRLLDG